MRMHGTLSRRIDCHQRTQQSVRAIVPQHRVTSCRRLAVFGAGFASRTAVLAHRGVILWSVLRRGAISFCAVPPCRGVQLALSCVLLNRSVSAPLPPDICHRQSGSAVRHLWRRLSVQHQPCIFRIMTCCAIGCVLVGRRCAVVPAAWQTFQQRRSADNGCPPVTVRHLSQLMQMLDVSRGAVLEHQVGLLSSSSGSARHGHGWL